MKTTNEIKKMSALELLSTFTEDGDVKIETVGVDQNYDKEITTLMFENEAIEISGSSVAVVDYYTPSENVSSVCERATKEQFKTWFADCNDWYRSYVSECEENNIEPKNENDWAEDLADCELDEWDGDESYTIQAGF